ncbi:hypothetical protein BGZ96_005389 [Linnemannia gamsii]|uniref:FBD domain-containing protein n=1 Tax=Linnemannia gamsii TaxID=64522 RepID=A0ABQ7JHC9_9FUNG|nr:hypothetical protein BGZ96_005389 [Linnemannia gamsii]
MRVSREWFKDFVGPVWHTIDLAKDKKFIEVRPQVLGKYGRSIRQVRNILTFKDIKTLQHPQVDSVVSMSVFNFTNPFERTLVFDLIRRSNATLTELDFRGQAPPPNPRELQYQNGNYLEAGILSTCLTSCTGSPAIGSLLTSLSLTRICFSHEGFTTLLRNSPVLRHLALFQVAILHFNEAFEQYRNSSITHLHAALDEICMPDPGPGWAPSLLYQFSQLQEWHLTAVDRSKNWGNDAAFRRELRDCCPRLKTLRFDPVLETDKLSDLLFNSFRQPESCTFSAKNLSQGMVLSLICHLKTLTTVILTDKCTDRATLRWLYLIPKSCSHLEVLSMQEVVLDMDSVDDHEWSCKYLRELRVRFEGLEDARDIIECLKNVYIQRRRPNTHLPAVESISSRVSRHLLQFDRLAIVSLGSNTYNLRLADAE